MAYSASLEGDHPATSSPSDSTLHPRDLEIRAYAPEDLERVLELYQTSFLEAGPLELANEDTFRRSIDSWTAWVAVHSSEVVGFVHLEFFEDHPTRLLTLTLETSHLRATSAEVPPHMLAAQQAHAKAAGHDIAASLEPVSGLEGHWRRAPCTKDAVISAIAVSPESRKLGVGRRLLAAALEGARELGVHRVFAHCLLGAESASAHLFLAVGFRPLTTIRPYYRSGAEVQIQAFDVSIADGPGPRDAQSPEPPEGLSAGAGVLIGLVAGPMAALLGARAGWSEAGIGLIVLLLAFVLASAVQTRRRFELARSRVFVHEDRLVREEAGQVTATLPLGIPWSGACIFRRGADIALVLRNPSGSMAVGPTRFAPELADVLARAGIWTSYAIFHFHWGIEAVHLQKVIVPGAIAFAFYGARLEHQLVAIVALLSAGLLVALQAYRLADERLRSTRFLGLIAGPCLLVVSGIGALLLLRG